MVGHNSIKGLLVVPISLLQESEDKSVLVVEVVRDLESFLLTELGKSVQMSLFFVSQLLAKEDEPLVRSRLNDEEDIVEGGLVFLYSVVHDTFRDTCVNHN